MYRYFIINKPYDMVSQFVSPDKVHLLGELDYDFPEGIHALGRLDNHSEGLLILTTNKKITRLLFESEQPHKRTYLVMVNKIMSQEALERELPLCVERASLLGLSAPAVGTLGPCSACRFE